MRNFSFKIKSLFHRKSSTLFLQLRRLLFIFVYCNVFYITLKIVRFFQHVISLNYLTSNTLLHINHIIGRIWNAKRIVDCNCYIPWHLKTFRRLFIQSTSLLSLSLSVIFSLLRTFRENIPNTLIASPKNQRPPIKIRAYVSPLMTREKPRLRLFVSRRLARHRSRRRFDRYI